jgi:Trk K+ transport system NAD-binding subunit
VTELEQVGQVRVVAVGRLGVAQIPKPDLVAQEGDVAYVAVSGDSIAAFDERLAQGATGRH